MRVEGENRRFSSSKGDVTKAQDLALAVTNLISLEEHLAFTAMKTGNGDFYEMARAVRKIRIMCLRNLIGEPAGELWCSSKHALSAMMRLFEVASKEESAKCEEYMKAAFDLYQLFWLFKEIGNHGTKAKAAKIKAR
ncbi:MAG: hypothetical protein HY368_03250 [Candidatus Aenigmarchaeota archaeon]|nr:hypothetical protein [Candidatus Aenigmarchaeota archaeon]